MATLADCHERSGLAEASGVFGRGTVNHGGL